MCGGEGEGGVHSELLELETEIKKKVIIMISFIYNIFCIHFVFIVCSVVFQHLLGIMVMLHTQEF